MGRRDIMKNVTVLNKVSAGSDHRMVRAEIKTNLKRERKNLVSKPLTNLINLQNKKPEFAVNIENRYAALNNEDYLDIEETNDNFTRILNEAALEVGEWKEKKARGIMIVGKIDPWIT